MKKLLTFLLGLASGIALIFMIFKKFFDLVDRLSETDDHLKTVALDQFIPAFGELLTSTTQCMLYGKSSHAKIKKLHNYRNIYVKTLDAAADILKNFRNKISDQGYVTIAELCEMSGIDTTTLTDYHRGWTEYDDIDYIKQGDYDIYKIILNDPKIIEDLTY